MSILFWYYKPIISTNGGVERVTDVLATYFKDNGYRVFFLSFEKMGMCSDCHYFLPNSEDLMSVENLRYAENLIFNKRISIIIIIIIIQTGLKDHHRSKYRYRRKQFIKTKKLFHCAFLYLVNYSSL